MLNKYPAWKNLLILLVVFLGFLYSVPNIYPDDEAIQISADGGSMNESDMATITTALEAAQVDFFGEEVTDEVIDGKQSVVWRQALNRVHAQKSIIKWCLD